MQVLPRLFELLLELIARLALHQPFRWIADRITRTPRRKSKRKVMVMADSGGRRVPCGNVEVIDKNNETHGPSDGDGVLELPHELQGTEVMLRDATTKLDLGSRHLEFAQTGPTVLIILPH